MNNSQAFIQQLFYALHDAVVFDFVKTDGTKEQVRKVNSWTESDLEFTSIDNDKKFKLTLVDDSNQDGAITIELYSIQERRAGLLGLRRVFENVAIDEFLVDSSKFTEEDSYQALLMLCLHAGFNPKEFIENVKERLEEIIEQRDNFIITAKKFDDQIIAPL